MVDIAKLRFSVNTEELKGAENALKDVETQGTKTENSTRKLNKSFDLLKVAAGAVAFAFTIEKLTKYSDTLTTIESRIRLVTTSFEQLKQVQSELFTISNNARVGMESTAELYGRIARSVKETEFTHRQLLQVTDSISKSLAISGGSAESANAALTQLGQGLASGTLRGEELRSVMEQTPRLAEAIAAGMSTTIGGLRKVAAEGKITSEVVINAMLNQKAVIDEEFKDVGITIAQSMTVAENSFTFFVGEIDNALGASDSLASGIKSLSETMVSSAGLIAHGFLGIKLVFNVLEVSFYEVVVFINKGIEGVGNAWGNMSALMQNAFKGMIDSVGKMFYSLVNFMLEKMGDFLNLLSDGLGGALSLAGIDNPFGQISLSIGEYESSVETAIYTTKKLFNDDWADNKLKDAIEAGAKTYEKLQQGIQETEKSSKSLLDTLVRGATNKSSEIDSSPSKKSRGSSGASDLAAAQSALEKFNETRISGYKEYLEIMGGEDNLAELAAINATEKFEKLNKVLNLTAKEQKDLFKKLGKDGKKELSKIVKEANKLQQSMMNSALSISGMIGGVFGSITGELYEFYNTVAELQAVASAKSQADSATTGAAAVGPSIAKAGADAGIYGAVAMAALLAAFGMAGSGAFDSTMSQAQIDSYKGRTDFEDESIANLSSVFEDANNSLLPYTKLMSESLKAVEQNTFRLAQSFNSSGGLRLDGTDFVGRENESFWGDYKTSLVDSKLELSNIGFSGNISADKVQEVLTEKSSWFGLVNSSYITTTREAVGSNITDYLNAVMKDGNDLIVSGADSLGYDVRDQLSKYEVAMAGISFEGLSQDEINQRMQGVFSEIFSGAINSLDGVGSLVEKYAQGAEKPLQTLSRIAVEYEQASDQFAQLGISFVDTWTQMADATYTAQQKVLDIVNASGGSAAFSENTNSFITGFYSEEEQNALHLRTLTQNMNALGLELPNTADGFKKLVLGFNVTDEASAKTYAELLKLSDSASQMYNANKELLEQEKELLEQGKERIAAARDSLRAFKLSDQSLLSFTDKIALLGNTVTDTNTAQQSLDFAYKNAVNVQDYRSQAIRLEHELNTNISKEQTTLRDVNNTLAEMSKTAKDSSKEQQQTNVALQSQIEILREQLVTLKGIDNGAKEQNESSTTRDVQNILYA